MLGGPCFSRPGEAAAIGGVVDWPVHRSSARWLHPSQQRLLLLGFDWAGCGFWRVFVRESGKADLLVASDFAHRAARCNTVVCASSLCDRGEGESQGGTRE